MKRLPLASLALLSLLSASSALACSAQLKGRDSLCALADRFAAAKSALRHEGYKIPERIADVLAPRFVNGTDWQRDRAKFDYTPWLEYAPAPKTWLQWDIGRAQAERQVRANLKAGSIAEITEDWIRALHETALNGLLANPRDFRKGMVVGAQYFADSALTKAQIAGLRDPSYMSSLEDGKPLLTWQSTACVDAAWLATPADKRTLQHIAPDQYFTDAAGVQHQCGYFAYETKPEDVERVFNLWRDRVNAEIRAFNQGDLNEDPVMLATRAQRWFVSIHPFEDGNGRLSRFVLELILESVGLPVPALADMNLDTMSTEPQWKDIVSQAMITHVETLEACAKNNKADGCESVKRYPPGASFLKHIFKPVPR